MTRKVAEQPRREEGLDVADRTRKKPDFWTYYWRDALGPDFKKRWPHLYDALVEELGRDSKIEKVRRLRDRAATARRGGERSVSARHETTLEACSDLGVRMTTRDVF